MGFLRRSERAQGYGEPMEAVALVLDDGESRLVLVGADIIGFAGAWSQEIRARIAATVGCPAHHVLLNAQHTHAGPPIPGWEKIGGDVEWHEEERRYGAAVADLIVSSAATAARALEPARVGLGRVTAGALTVNRRQRHETGTILGWNPDEACDRDVAVIRVDDLVGKAIATVVSFACHPVVIGPDVPEASSDFVGPLRRRVRDWTGGECLFLQGCAGNVLPFEAFHTESGPERVFGEVLALEALRARAAAQFEQTRPEQVPFQSAVPVAIWRNVPTGSVTNMSLSAVEKEVEVPLMAPPSLDEIREIRFELETRARAMQEGGEPRTAWNHLLHHARWATAIEARIADGTVEHEVPAPVQALRIGDACITAWPCEPFCELGLEVKARSISPFPITLGYSNDLIGYVPTRREYAFGGYEPLVAQRHFSRPAPYAPEAGELLVETALALTNLLYPEANREH